MWMAASLSALSITLWLVVKVVALFAHTGAAYRSLEATTEGSRDRLAMDGPPTLGIRRLIALAELNAAADTILILVVKVNLESSITPRYLTARLTATR